MSSNTRRVKQHNKYALGFANRDSRIAPDIPTDTPFDRCFDSVRPHISMIPLLSRYRGHERHLERLIDQWETLDRKVDQPQ